MLKPLEPLVYQLKVVLQGISLMIWRRILVHSDSTIADLHYILQTLNRDSRVLAGLDCLNLVEKLDWTGLSPDCCLRNSPVVPPCWICSCRASRS